MVRQIVLELLFYFFAVTMENLIFKDQERKYSHYQDFTEDFFLTREPIRSYVQHDSSNLLEKKKTDKSKKQIQLEEREKFRYFMNKREKINFEDLL